MTKNKHYKIIEIYKHFEYGNCLMIIKDNSNKVGYSIKKIKGENYENFFFTIKEIRLQKLQKINKLTTEEKHTH